MGSTMQGSNWGVEFDRKITNEQWTSIGRGLDDTYDPRFLDFDIDQCLALIERVVPGITVVRQVAFVGFGVHLSELRLSGRRSNV